MAKKKFKFGVTIGVHDPAGDVAEVMDTFGRIIVAGSKGLRHVPPGEEIEMEEAEAARIIERHGGYDDYVKNRQAKAAAQNANTKAPIRFIHNENT